MIRGISALSLHSFCPVQSPQARLMVVSQVKSEEVRAAKRGWTDAERQLRSCTDAAQQRVTKAEERLTEQRYLTMQIASHSSRWTQVPALS